ncbi:MAG: hypothetical protein ACI8TX_000197 [Hyphomicrobiaceae bacterium]|jgi:hypothetical protein
MTELCRLAADTNVERVLEVLSRDGALILEDVLSGEEVDRIQGEIAPYVDATELGRDEFTGFHTTRTGALIARSAGTRRLTMDPTVLATARGFLAPWCERIQLHLSQVIRICPGEVSQAIHRDRWAWGTHLKDIEPQCNTIWAITDFTEANGATRVAPGSTGWPDDRRPLPEEITRAVMKRGSVLIYTGAVFHGGGANDSNGDRVGINLTYTLGWLRQEENQYLSCPPQIARDFEPELQDLLGYTVGGYALGYYTPPLPAGQGPGIVGPEYAVGREADQLGSAELLEELRNATIGEGKI